VGGDEPGRRAASIHDFVIGLPDRYERIAGERGPRFCVAESSDGSARELRMVADATLGVLRRPGGEVVVLSPAVPLSSLMVLDLSRLLAGPCCTSVHDDLGAGVIKVEVPGTGTEPASGSRPGRVGKRKLFSRTIGCKTRFGSSS
jgi:hypothetical protein